MVSRARKMPLESFAYSDCFRKQRGRLLCKKQINMHIRLGHLILLNQIFDCYLIKYTLALAGARSLTSSGNLSISFLQKNTILHKYLIILKFYKLA